MNTLPQTDDARPPGFRLNPCVATLDPKLIESFRGVPVAHASDVMGRATGARGLVAYHGSLAMSLCGPAVTVRFRPGDNLMIHAAMAVARAGDVVVIDGGGDLPTAVIGGLTRTSAIARELGGFVVDGAIRDVAEWAESVIPAYARGHSHRGPSKDGPGEVNVPVACAGLAVNPGDLVLGDADGVVAIPAADAERVLHRCRDHAAREDETRRKNANGIIDHERFNALLRAKGCPVRTGIAWWVLPDPTLRQFRRAAECRRRPSRSGDKRTLHTLQNGSVDAGAWPGQRHCTDESLAAAEHRG